ncbi:MAG: NfuA family Fe-S biogenesis protein [Xanthomonadaceae bacterium]|jgi:Fe/S biogenesis protein NfuA|nr:NfuA family Fe-S biogenesis protein [Xanthomonadaceae bacterium]
MVTIGPEAQTHFRRLLDQQGVAGMGVRLKVLRPGTAQADCQLEFCEPGDLAGDEWIVECEGFNLYVESASTAWLDGASIDYQRNPTGGQLTIRAPHIKGRLPGADAGPVERIQYVLESEINPGLASHGGRVSLVSLEADGVAVLRFGGGCHGCGMVDVTLREGIETTLRARVPEVTGVRDATDHASGENPYMRRSG